RFRRYTDDGIGTSIELDCFADNVRICTQPALPQAVTNHDHGVRAETLVFLRQESSTQNWSDLQNIEIVTADHLAPDHIVLVLSADGCLGHVFGNETFKDRILIAIVGKVRIGKAVTLAAV